MLNRQSLTGLILMPMLCACASTFDQDSALAVTPYTIADGGQLVVETTLNGQGPFRFSLDTGASISVVFERLRESLSLEPVPGASVTVHGVVASQAFPLVDIDQMRLGEEIWANPRMVLLPDQEAVTAQIDGILGIDFLSAYAVGFSTADRRMRLYAVDRVASNAYRGWASIPMTLESISDGTASLYLFEIEINGRKLPALFDLGAGSNLINWSAARSLGLTPASAKSGDRVSGAFGSLTDVARLNVEELSTEGISWRNEKFSVGDFGIFEIFELGDGPAVILGAGLFSQRDFVIDFARGRVLVKVAMDDEDSR
ncbi:MAG: retroviral-like aspartic protease family protein [Gammaproteobacteria bacterium]|nr:retroviral-like aspartic protease family protein [Gammaproteobacteria bacterium]